MLLNKAIAAAVVTKSFDDNDISDLLMEFKESLGRYRRVVHGGIQDNKSSVVEERVAGDMAGWNGLETRLKEIQPRLDATSSDQGGLNTFNDKNITTEMNAMTIFTANMLAENHLGEVQTNVLATIGRIAGAVALGVLGVASLGLGFGAGAVAVAGCVELVSLIPIGMAAAEAGFLASAIVVGAGAAHLAQKGAHSAFSSMFALASGADAATASRLRSELYQESASSYKKQLVVVASAATLNWKVDMDALDLENLLAESSMPIVKNPKHQKLVANYIDVVRKIVDLRKACQKLVFLVINGKQGVGKSWFIKAIKSKHGGPRLGTDMPEYFRYTAHVNCSSRVYFVDLPGGDSYNDKLRLYLRELCGMSTIGINLFEFDTRPQILTDEIIAMRRMHNSCDHILICLNKVMSKGIVLKKNDPESHAKMNGYYNTWRGFFDENNIKLPKFDLMLTDMSGTSDVRPPEGTEDDSDSDNDCEKFDRKARRNIEKLLDNGGASRNEVVAWINAKIDMVLQQAAP
ncbi:Aste57867_23774 [Aphanomyces stellatus]|uniref:Aste57867_23774 protein n=1 Tax=Aphanomyces stellatus TaxID=120398 RepID=A0A485LQG1_9STRA|nr:hypothetical protein As57867_023701 [Aphanomyces stellatus]VFU00419.1 Aste57867_23774 [Aphanomyces stellatus]